MPRNTSSQGDIARCYARTPLGALIAASQISARIGYSDQWRQVVEHQTVPGPGQREYLRKNAGLTTAQMPAAGSVAQTAAFKFITYTPDTAVIQLVTRFNNGQYQATLVTVR